MPLSPAARDVVDRIEELLDRSGWPDLDRDAITITEGRDTALVVLPHRREADMSIECEIEQRVVKVRYGPEHLSFTRTDDALRFLEMLGDGRVELLVQRNPVWTSLRSYRDGLALPFHRAGHPWPNFRFATERLRFGFR